MRNFSLGAMLAVQLLGILALLAPYDAGSAATIVLKDGAVIYGEIETLQNDLYTIKTESLGTVRVNKQDVRTIDQGGKPAPPSSQSSQSSPDPTDVESLQLHMMQNLSLISMIEALQNDPEVQAVMSDPEIINAINAGDYGALLSNPKIIALTQNPKMREIIEEAQ